MANIKSARKRAKLAKRRQLYNQHRKQELKTYTKKIVAALNDNDVTTAKELFTITEGKIARAKGKGVLKPRTAARKISKLAQKIARVQS